MGGSAVNTTVSLNQLQLFLFCMLYDCVKCRQHPYAGKACFSERLRMRVTVLILFMICIVLVKLGRNSTWLCGTYMYAECCYLQIDCTLHTYILSLPQLAYRRHTHSVPPWRFKIGILPFARRGGCWSYRSDNQALGAVAFYPCGPRRLYGSRYQTW